MFEGHEELKIVPEKLRDGRERGCRHSCHQSTDILSCAPGCGLKVEAHIKLGFLNIEALVVQQSGSERDLNFDILGRIICS